MMKPVNVSIKGASELSRIKSQQQSRGVLLAQRHREAAGHGTRLGPVLTRWVWMMLLYSRATRLAHFRASLSRLCSSAEPLSLCSCITFKHTENS